MTGGYVPPMTIGQECELDVPGRPTLRGKIALWRQVDDYVFAVSLDLGAGRLQPILMIRDQDGVMHAEMPDPKSADDIAVRQLLGLPIRMAVNQQASVLAKQVLSARWPEPALPSQNRKVTS
jgi:hypothetical protein